MEEIVENPDIVYLLEDFEMLVIKKMVDYIKACDNPAEDIKAEHDFFGRNIKDSLVKELVETVRARQQEMTTDENYNWLIISNRQFKESPTLRFDDLQVKYLKQYFSPYKVPDDGQELQDSLRYFVEALNRYIKHYSTYVDVVQHSLEEFKKEYYGLKPNSNSQQNVPPKKKLKTNLTVKEIAYLFRALESVKIIESNQKTDIFNFIAESFSSKQKEDISAKSLKNAYTTPDLNAVDFWLQKFGDCKEKARKDKENLSQ